MSTVVENVVPSISAPKRGDDVLMAKSAWSWMFLAAVGLAAGASATGWFVDGFYDKDGEELEIRGRYGDLVILSLAVPLGLMAFIFDRCNDSVWARPVMLGVITYFGFMYGVLAFQYHENALFVLYAAILGGSLLLGFTGLVDNSKVLATPRKCLATRIASVVLMLAALSGYRFWLSDVISALVDGATADSLEGTDVPANAARVIDMSITLPLAIFGSIRLWSRRRVGLLASAMMSTFFVLIGTTVLVMEAGLSKETGQESETGILVGYGTAIGLSLVVVIVTYTQILDTSAIEGQGPCIDASPESDGHDPSSTTDV